MKCKYCGKEFFDKKLKDACPTCKSKLPSVKRFVEECERFKRRIGYEPKREVQTDDESTL